VGRVTDFLTPEAALEIGYPIAGAPVGISEEGVIERPAIKRHYLGHEWPLVQFADGGEYLMIPSDFILDNGAGDIKAHRRQVSPLCDCHIRC
jgi:hypothetical protein